MSRIGNKIIDIPGGVEVTLSENNHMVVKGSKGILEQTFNKDMIINIENGQIEIKRPSDIKKYKQLHGTTRALVSNMIIGVTDGYKIDLEIIGLGYRAAINDNKLVLTIGYSHLVEFDLIDDVKVEVPKPTEISLSGIDKQIVGQFAAVVRATRKPEPYKGKGIRYKGEQVKKKEGKKAGK